MRRGVCGYGDGRDHRSRESHSNSTCGRRQVMGMRGGGGGGCHRGYLLVSVEGSLVGSGGMDGDGWGRVGLTLWLGDGVGGSVASLMTTTEAVIVDLPEDKSVAMPGGGGHGGHGRNGRYGLLGAA